MKKVSDVLQNGKYKFYVATRLYDYSQKLQAEKLEETIIDTAKKAMKVDDVSHKITFVPFRDINEEKIISEERSRIIFEKDIKQLSSEIIAMVAIYNDISKDDGVAFEIGYLYANDIPIFLLNTDFIWYKRMSDDEEFLYDPIITKMSRNIVHYSDIPDAPITFKQRLVEGFAEALAALSESLSKFIEEPFVLNKKKVLNYHLEGSVFIDFGGCRCEYQREYALRVKNALIPYASNIYVSERYGLNQYTLSQWANRDMENLKMVDILIFSADEPEVDSGSAAMVGYAYAMNKIIIMYYSGNIEILGDGKQRMRKNLMIENACSVIETSIEGLIETVVNTLIEKEVAK